MNLKIGCAMRLTLILAFIFILLPVSADLADNSELYEGKEYKNALQYIINIIIYQSTLTINYNNF